MSKRVRAAQRDLRYAAEVPEGIGLDFEIIGEIRSMETIASGRRIRILSRLNRERGKGNWRKLKGIATVRLEDGTIVEAEVHWFEAHGIGPKKLKIKRIL